MGTGDWNDGMNRVGREGAGESVWLAWLLYATLRDFSEVAETLGERERAARWLSARDAMALAVERDGWDGRWYRRAFFDDGTAMGSKPNAECRIDFIAQSWAVLSKAAPDERAALAMQAAEEELVRERDGLILLLAPPFSGAHPPLATSQPTLPASERTAASTPTQPRGRSWPLQRSARATKRSGCSG